MSSEMESNVSSTSDENANVDTQKRQIYRMKKMVAKHLHREKRRHQHQKSLAVKQMKNIAEGVSGKASLWLDLDRMPRSKFRKRSKSVVDADEERDMKHLRLLGDLKHHNDVCIELNERIIDILSKM